MIDPQQELFTLIRTGLVNKFGESMVFDGFLPPEGTPYPFIYIADSQQIDQENKSAIFGTISQTIHVWHNTPLERGRVSVILLEIKNVLRGIKGEGYQFDVRGMDQQIISDSITSATLMHGILIADFDFS